MRTHSPPLLHQQCPAHSHQSYDAAVYEDAAASSWTAIACPDDNERVNYVVSGGGPRVEACDTRLRGEA